MIQLYYARPSAYARPVWLALIEKQLPFELVAVDLRGEQFEESFQAVNPFGHVPVLVDDGFRVIECNAILDYLEAKYPMRSLVPKNPEAISKMKMVQSIAFSELLPAFFRMVAYSKAAVEADYGRLRMMNTLSFLENLLGEARYFAGEQLTLAEIVAGTLVYRVDAVGVPLADYPRLKAWSDRLIVRPTWQQIELSEKEWSQFQRRLRVLPKFWEKQRRLRSASIERSQSASIGRS